MTPLVSILIPVYNAERYLKNTIESALSQTWKNKEIIIVNDGSTDNTATILNKFDSKNLLVINQENKGACTARNQAYRVSQGDFIQFMDSDDLFNNDKIKYQMDRLLNSSTDTVATCQWARFYNDDVSTAHFYHHPDYKDFEKPIDWLLMCFSGKGTMPPLSWLMPRKIVEKVGPWDERLSLNDDTEYYTRVVLNSSQIYYCEKSKAYYRSNINGLSSRDDIEAIRSYFLVCQLCTKHLLKYETSDRIYNACANIWQSFIYRVYPDAPELLKLAEEKVKSLGGSSLDLRGSKLFKIIESFIGWKNARKLQILYRRRKYKE